MAAPAPLTPLGREVFYALAGDAVPPRLTRNSAPKNNEARTRQLSIDTILQSNAIKSPQMHSDHDTSLTTFAIVRNYCEFLSANNKFPDTTDPEQFFNYNRALSPFYFVKMAFLDYILRQLHDIDINFIDVTVGAEDNEGDTSGVIITQSTTTNQEIFITIKKIRYNNAVGNGLGDQFKFNTPWTTLTQNNCIITFSVSDQQN